jgi:hypothetical protein
MAAVVDLFSVKYGALALLVLQNTFLVVFMRYSRTTSGPLYASSTAVFMMEVSPSLTPHSSLSSVDQIHFMQSGRSNRGREHQFLSPAAP